MSILGLITITVPTLALRLRLNIGRRVWDRLGLGANRSAGLACDVRNRAGFDVGLVGGDNVGVWISLALGLRVDLGLVFRGVGDRSHWIGLGLHGGVIFGDRLCGSTDTRNGIRLHFSSWLATDAGDGNIDSLCGEICLGLSLNLGLGLVHSRAGRLGLVVTGEGCGKGSRSQETEDDVLEEHLDYRESD